MEEAGKAAWCRWSWEENKLFEVALAVVDEKHPDRWEVVAAMIGGHKTADDVNKHYEILLQDLQLIESGHFDHKLVQHFVSAISTQCNLLGCSKSIAYEKNTPC